MRFCYAHRRFALYPHVRSYLELTPTDYSDEFLSKVKSLGFDALEVGYDVLEQLDNKSAMADFAKRLAGFGLKVGAIRCGGSLSSARYAERNRARLLLAIEAAAQVEAEVVNGALSAPARYPGCPPNSIPGSGTGWLVSQDSSRSAMIWELEHLAKLLREATRKAADHRLKVSVEMHQNSLIDNSWSAVLLHQMVGHSAFGINPDVGNLLWTYDVPEEDYDAAIKALAPISIYWHCKNFFRVYHPENNRSVFIRIPLPDGEIDYRFAVSAMAAADYSGYMAIEGAWGGDQWHADRRSLEYAQKLWDEARG